MIQYEREGEEKRVSSEAIEILYKKVEDYKQLYEEKRLMLKRSYEESIPLHERLERKMNERSQDEEEGVISSRLPRVDKEAILNDLEMEFIQKHPFLREEIKKTSPLSNLEKATEITTTETTTAQKQRIHVSLEEFNNVNKPLYFEEKKETFAFAPAPAPAPAPTAHTLTDDDIAERRLPLSQLQTLPIMKKVWFLICTNYLVL